MVYGICNLNAPLKGFSFGFDSRVVDSGPDEEAFLILENEILSFIIFSITSRI